MLAEPHRRRRRAARRHRQPQFRQSREARRSWASWSAPSKASARPARALAFPVVSGNVSLYNETNGVGDPADPGDRRRRPARRRRRRMATLAFKAEGEAILLVGAPAEWGTHLGQSIYLREILGREDGPPPPVDLAHEKRGRRLRPRPDPRRPGHRRATTSPTAASRSRSPRWRWPRASAPRSTQLDGAVAPAGPLRRGPGPLRRHRRAATLSTRSSARAADGRRLHAPGSATPAATDLKLGRRRFHICCKARGSPRELVSGFHGRRLSERRRRLRRPPWR